MGLGKTIEMLALILANSSPATFTEQSCQELQSIHDPIDKREEERRMSCICGVDYVSVISAHLDNHSTIQCFRCKIWSHTRCVGVRKGNKIQIWKCSTCVSHELGRKRLINSKTTLIVCPPSILSQWESEIKRHTVPGSLKVLTYLGQPQPLGSKILNVTTPEDIASADIVLTSYDVLREDLYRNPDREETKSLRYQKRYQIIPTPLTSVRFWRVAVDEAQMVESSTAKATEMAMKIHAFNRWCITGTPISRGLEDLYGLMRFLQVRPLNHRFWWNKIIQFPLEQSKDTQALASLLRVFKPSEGGIMWRSSKGDVSHEINIPEQKIISTPLNFSQIERHFYERQHRSCAGLARRNLPKAALNAGERMIASTDCQSNAPNERSLAANREKIVQFSDRLLTKREERKIIAPLVRLRQACVHPQVGAGGIQSLSQVETPMSMEDVLRVLINKARQEAEDAQRVVLADLNGIAGLKILQNMKAEAVSLYRRVLSVSETNKDLVRTDVLQKLHAIHNLSDLLSLKIDGIGHTINDDKLPKEKLALQEKYLQEPMARLTLATQELAALEDDVLKLWARIGLPKAFKGTLNFSPSLCCTGLIFV